MPSPKELTAEQIKLVRELRMKPTPTKRITGSRKIAEITGFPERAIRRALGIATESSGILFGKRLYPVVERIEAPENLFVERDMRLNEPRSLSQVVFGDPPYSQSALARHGLGQS